MFTNFNAILFPIYVEISYANFCVLDLLNMILFCTLRNLQYEDPESEKSNFSLLMYSFHDSTNGISYHLIRIPFI